MARLDEGPTPWRRGDRLCIGAQCRHILSRGCLPAV